ncbi:MAG: HAD hydrolase-like protein [Oscillospiraceae bacterium]|nr:HAD hydrolase-like protein [Oscillospiraceae bacterium]
MINSVFFDLDGTISNSFEGISNGILYALEKLGAPLPPRESLASFLGPPLFDEFKRVFGFDDDTAREAVRLYRVYYPEKGIYEQTPIEGALELLKGLRALGIKICLATSKPLAYAEKIIPMFGFSEYFGGIYGASLDGKISAKADVIALALRESASLPETTLMVGDRFYDVEGAHACKVRCAGVLSGFGCRREFEDCGADFIAENLLDVFQIVKEENGLA